MRPIDADHLKCLIDLDDFDTISDKIAAKFAVDLVPTLEVRKVVHGHWVLKENKHLGFDVYGCSECGTTDLWKCKYCSECGATMDGEEG